MAHRGGVLAVENGERFNALRRLRSSALLAIRFRVAAKLAKNGDKDREEKREAFKSSD